MTEEVQWSWTDGWLLMALFLGGADDGVLLHDLIGTADAINHAIPTTRQLSRALTKFVQCGLVNVTGGQYSISAEHVRALRKASEGKGGLFASVDKGLKFLHSSGLVPRSDERVELTDAEVEAAYELYLVKLQQG